MSTKETEISDALEEMTDPTDPAANIANGILRGLADGSIPHCPEQTKKRTPGEFHFDCSIGPGEGVAPLIPSTRPPSDTRPAVS